MEATLDLDKTHTTIRRFLTGTLDRTAAGGYVVGISGGLDSAVVATLAVEAVGPDRVLGLLMPYRASAPSSTADGKNLVAQLRMPHRLVDISPMIDAYFARIDDSNRVRAGNKMARERMAVLFDVSHELGRLVLGTGNRTEICLGYTTWFGDSACSVNPIGELYKTEVRQLACRLGVSAAIVDKIPSADLWKGQTDEGEIGVSYDTADGILRKIVEEGVRSLAALESCGFHATDVSRVVSLMNRHAFKRALPEIAPLGRRPIPAEIALEE